MTGHGKYRYGRAEAIHNLVDGDSPHYPCIFSAQLARLPSSMA
jgi:hypothetical protein